MSCAVRGDGASPAFVTRHCCWRPRNKRQQSLHGRWRRADSGRAFVCVVPPRWRRQRYVAGTVSVEAGRSHRVDGRRLTAPHQWRRLAAAAGSQQREGPAALFVSRQSTLAGSSWLVATCACHPIEGSTSSPPRRWCGIILTASVAERAADDHPRRCARHSS